MTYINYKGEIYKKVSLKELPKAELLKIIEDIKQEEVENFKFPLSGPLTEPFPYTDGAGPWTLDYDKLTGIPGMVLTNTEKMRKDFIDNNTNTGNTK